MTPELVDTHCHLDFNRFDHDRNSVIRRAVEAGVRRIVVPGTSLETSRQAIILAEQYDQIYAAVGIHPNDIPHGVWDVPLPDGNSDAASAAIVQELRDLAAHSKVVAIGEIGLDYHWDRTPHHIQRHWLNYQLELARELGLPIIIHNREATADVLSHLHSWLQTGLPDDLRQAPGVLHSFSGSWEDAQAALEAGFCLGITGPITFRKADELRRVARNAPIDRLLIETDAPFLTPHPHRGQRNEPAYVRYVAEGLGEVRSVPVERIAVETTCNAAVLFKWDRI